MKKADVLKLVKVVKHGVKKKTPEILTGIGIAGMVTTVVLSVRATPKAMELIEQKELENAERDNTDIQKLTPVETIKVAWKPYVPALLTGLGSTACLIGGISVSARRTAALATAYKISETALSEYKEKMIEVVGEKKAKEIKEKINSDKIENNPVTKSNVIITGKGDTLCCDLAFNQYFRSDIEKIKKAVNEINRQLTYDMYVSLNEFYDELGIPHIPIGDELGWNLDNGLVEVSFGSQIADDGTPCITMEYNIGPRYDYSKLL